ncbi:Synaptobrevin [Trinorchestia longiramus]|nr:Synaptobrevin [Trinorchestia longiramus]
MSILYVVIAQGPVVLARYASCAGNFQDVADQVLSRLAMDEVSAPRMTFTHDAYLTHYLLNNGIAYLCITDASFDRYRSFLFLEDIRERFQAAFQSDPKDASPYVWNDSLAEVLEQRMDHHNENPNMDAILTMRAQVEDVQETLDRSIRELADRGERLELLVDKTNNLNAASVTFRTRSQEVARRAWWANAKTWVVIGAVVVLSIYLLGAAICGWAWNTCKSS